MYFVATEIQEPDTGCVWKQVSAVDDLLVSGCPHQGTYHGKSLKECMDIMKSKECANVINWNKNSCNVKMCDDVNYPLMADYSLHATYVYQCPTGMY